MNRYRDWLDQSERDLSRAAIDIQYAYWEWACFTCQQAAEKAIKALLMNRGLAAWGHAITAMLRHLDNPAVPTELMENAQLLDAYDMPTRHPNGFAQGKPADYFNQTKAEEAYRAASALIRFCKDHIR